MKRIAWLLILVSTMGWAQGACHRDVVQGGGQGIANVSVRVCAEGDTASPCNSGAVSLFANSALTVPLPGGNPTSTDANGNYGYCAATGTYNEQISGTNIVGINNTPVSLVGDLTKSANTLIKAQTMSGGIKTSPFNTLLSYGCAHDGTDASTCLNAAFAAATGTTLWLEPGYTYTHASTIVIPTGARILAAGNVDGSAGVAAFKYTGSGIAWAVTSGVSNPYTYATRLSGFRIYSTGSATVCLDLDHMQEGEIDHMTIGGGNGNGCGIGVNAHGISLSSVHHNRITWNTTAFVVDGNNTVGAIPANPSAYNDVYENNFFECSAGIQFKSNWTTTYHDNYFEACDDWFKIDTSAGSYANNNIELINIHIRNNNGSKGADVAHVNPHFLHVTGAGTMNSLTNHIDIEGNWWDTTGSTQSAVVDSTTSGTIGLSIYARNNRITGSNTIWYTTRTAYSLQEENNVYAGPDGITPPTTPYVGMTPVYKRDATTFQVPTLFNVTGGYGTSYGWSANSLFIGAVGVSPNAASIGWGDGSGWKLNFGYFAGGGTTYTPTASLTDAGNATYNSVTAPTFSTTTGIGKVVLQQGSAGASGYIAWYKGDGTTRLGYMGNNNTDVQVNLENSAKWRLSGGNALIENNLSAASFAGAGTATFAAGASAGTSPGTPTCTTSHVCDSYSGTISFTMGTATTTGIALTVTTSITRTNQPNCRGSMYLTASPYTQIPVRMTDTTTTVIFNTGTAPTASTAYELTYECPGN